MLNILKKEIPILMYHRVIDDKKLTGKFGTYVLKEELEKQFELLKSKGYKTLFFSDLNQEILKNEKKERYVILTFDDGYMDNYTILLPLLKKYEFKATIYPVVNLKRNVWDIEKGEVSLELMGKEEFKELDRSGLVEFGGHTLTHCNLLEVDEETVIREINESKKILEEILEKEIISFAYPYGFFNEEIEKVVKNAGYIYGIATATGPDIIEENLYHIRRIGIFPKDDIQRYAKKITGKYNFEKRRKENLKKLRRKFSGFFKGEK